MALAPGLTENGAIEQIPQSCHEDSLRARDLGECAGPLRESDLSTFRSTKDSRITDMTSP